MKILHSKAHFLQLKQLNPYKNYKALRADLENTM